MLSIRECKTQVLQIFLQYCYSAILKIELHCSSIVKKKINFPRNFSLLSLIIFVLFSLFLLSFSSALSSLQTQTTSTSQHQHHTSQWFIFSGQLQSGGLCGCFFFFWLWPVLKGSGGYGWGGLWVTKIEVGHGVGHEDRSGLKWVVGMAEVGHDMGHGDWRSEWAEVGHGAGHGDWRGLRRGSRWGQCLQVSVVRLVFCWRVRCCWVSVVTLVFLFLFFLIWVFVPVGFWWIVGSGGVVGMVEARWWWLSSGGAVIKVEGRWRNKKGKIYFTV